MRGYNFENWRAFPLSLYSHCRFLIRKPGTSYQEMENFLTRKGKFPHKENFFPVRNPATSYQGTRTFFPRAMEPDDLTSFILHPFDKLRTSLHP
jgi:hypothetical protein